MFSVCSLGADVHVAHRANHVGEHGADSLQSQVAAHGLMDRRHYSAEEPLDHVLSDGIRTDTDSIDIVMVRSIASSPRFSQ